jgi:hypothetical protein
LAAPLAAKLAETFGARFAIDADPVRPRDSLEVAAA